MPGVIATIPRYQFSNLLGDPLVNGTLTVYLAGTTTPTNTWTDSALTSLNTNPITLDSRGECVLWLDSAVNYKFLLKDSGGATQWTVDNIRGGDSYAYNLAALLAASSGSALVGYTQGGASSTTLTVQSKLRQSVSVKDFGAVGDGSTDDTAAIQAAVNAALCVDFLGADSSYKVTGTITLRTGQSIIGCGAQIRQYTALTPIFNIVAKTDIRISGVKFYGLGTDYASSDANPYAVGVYGNGSEARIWVDSCYFYNFGYTSVRLRSSTDCRFTNNVVVGPGVGIVTDGYCYGFLADSGCSYITVEGNSFSQTGQGLRIEGSQKVVISNNQIFDVIRQHGMYIGGNCSDIAVTGNVVRNTTLIGIKVQVDPATVLDNINITVTGNVVDTCGDSGIVLTSGTPGTAYYVKNSAVTGNSIASTTGSGIALVNCVGVVCFGNSISFSTLYGIDIRYSTNIQLLGNLIRGSVRDAIRESAICSYVDIKNNRILDCCTGAVVGYTSGIWQGFAGTNWTIEGNFISDNAGTPQMTLGIFLTNGTWTTYSIRFNQIILTNAGSVTIRMIGATSFRQWEGNYMSAVSALSYAPTPTSVASVAALVLPQGPNVISVTGVTGITSIAADGNYNRTVTLVFSGILTVTNGSNLKLASNFTTAAGSALTIACDATNWYEIGRKA